MLFLSLVLAATELGLVALSPKLLKPVIWHGMSHLMCSKDVLAWHMELVLNILAELRRDE